ncbi:MAG: hypothetical protein ACPGYX_11225, partial [Oceanobacter sp.]
MANALPAVPVEQQILTLIDNHFALAATRVDDVYSRHFHRADVILNRHWRNRTDVPQDLLTLPRHVWGLANRAVGRHAAVLPESGKQQELRRILEQELLDLPGLEQQMEQLLQPWMLGYQEQLEGISALAPEQRHAFQDYVNHQLDRLQLPVEGFRDGLLSVTLILTGKAIGDNAMISSAATVGATVAKSIYLSHQTWWSAILAGWLGGPAWVGWMGAAGGILGALLLAPLLSPGIELGLNRWRARKILTQTVERAAQQLQQRDGVMLASQ